MTREDPAPALWATVSRILLWYDGPVLAELTARAADGREDRLLAMALPDGEAWPHVVAMPTRDRFDAWSRNMFDLRDLQLDPHTRHYLIGPKDRAFGAGSEVPLTPYEGTPPEAWLCDPGLIVRDTDVFDI